MDAVEVTDVELGRVNTANEEESIDRVDESGNNDAQENNNNIGNNDGSTNYSSSLFTSYSDYENNQTTNNNLDMSSAHNNNNNSNSNSKSPSSSFSKWKSITGGSRRIRFALQRSDYTNTGTNQEFRGIVATPIDAELSRPMGTGARFFRNLQNELLVDGGGEGANFMRLRSSVDGGEGNDDDGDDDDGDGVWGGGGDAEKDMKMEPENRMYRLQATRGSNDVGCCRRTMRFLNALINCGALTESSTEQNLYLGFGDPNRWIIYFFFWLFRKGWSTVIVLSVVWYYLFVLFFALLIVAAADLDSDCVRIGGQRFGDLSNRSKFMDSFSLSWNTFSTVGYGSTYPALSGESIESSDGNDSRCAFISFITSFEALVGVIFAGFIGAIFYAKVQRITQRADVQFGDPLTVRYGSGVDTNVIEDDEDKPQDETGGGSRRGKKSEMDPMDKFENAANKAAAAKLKPSPFPVITFRIANEMHNTLGGEIIGAQVDAVVLIESTKYDDQVSDDIAKQISLDRMKRSSHPNANTRLRKASSMKGLKFSNNDTDTQRSSERGIDKTSERSIETLATEDDMTERSSSIRGRGTVNAMNYLQNLNTLAHRGDIRRQEDKNRRRGGRVGIQNRTAHGVHQAVELETSEHPLFKRIWRFKHIIGQDSPLLTCEAQRAIMNNGGHWPHEWNNYRDVRKTTGRIAKRIPMMMMRRRRMPHRIVVVVRRMIVVRIVMPREGVEEGRGGGGG